MIVTSCDKHKIIISFSYKLLHYKDINIVNKE